MRTIVFSFIVFVFAHSCRTALTPVRLLGTSFLKDSSLNYSDTIMPGDRLSIQISCPEPDALRMFGDVGLLEVFVDEEGDFEFPVLGKLTAAGISTDSLKRKLIADLQAYLPSPSVHIKYLNYGFFIFTDASQKAVDNIPTGKVNLLEALALAGNIETLHLDNVRIIRKVKNQFSEGSINLFEKKCFSSPYFNIKQNDIIIISGKIKKKTSSEKVKEAMSYAATASSVIAMVIYLGSVFK